MNSVITEKNKEILKIAQTIERVNQHLSKMRIFEYDTLDEADPGKERSNSSDVSVEIGGPATHIKFAVLTRSEHTIIKTAVEQILNTRYVNAKMDLNSFCENHVAALISYPQK